jgi:uncharacterized membrane protein YphA (DoxX/SURF4 family)
MGMKINEPIGPAKWAPFFIRASLGLYFVLAGLGKLEVLAAFIEQVKGFGVLPANLASLYGTLLPYAEIFIGACLLLGLWTTLMGLLASLLLVSFIFAFGFFPGGHDLFNKDVILLAASLSLMYSGPGVYGSDNLRRPPGP